jgi:hypothetical protein
VWNNNQSPRPFTPSPGVLLINASRDVGLNSRWFAASAAEHECVLIQDDDILLPPATIEALYEAWQAEPEIIHGIFGRQPEGDGSYKYGNAPAGECPIVLTRALLVSRTHICRMLLHLPEFADIQRQGVPHGNGEDIIFSYVVRRYSGRMNRVHSLPVNELPANDAINRRPGHKQHRTNVVKFCERWLSSVQQTAVDSRIGIDESLPASLPVLSAPANGATEGLHVAAAD